MKAYLRLVQVNLKLALRERIAIFFNYIFPLIFFFAFGQLMHAEQGGVITQIVTMVLVIGILGNGLFGGGIRAVQDREQNILRRFKVAPISPAPMLVASMVTGWALYLPAVIITVALAHLLYGMPVPERWFSLLVLVSAGVIAFRAIGLIIASVANSAQESQILVQLVYLPMLFLTGTTFSIAILPSWAQALAHFLPATYLVTGMQGILIRGETVAQNWAVVLVLFVTTAVSTFVSVQLFRWEKEDKLRASAKLWLAAMVLPSVLLGGYQAYSHDQVEKTKVLYRDLMRSRTLLIRDARIFPGEGRGVGSGAVLVRGGKIAAVYDGPAPAPETLKAEPIEAAGKTVLPGLIDVQVHLAMPGGAYDPPASVAPDSAMPRALAAYLYSGITAVSSAGDPLTAAPRIRRTVNSGERLGAELFICGTVFTADGGYPRTLDEARSRVGDLKRAGVDAIEVVLDSGASGRLFNRMDLGVFRAIVEEAHRQGLPVSVRAGDARDIADALEAGADSIESASAHGPIPDDLLARMARQNVAYVPALSAIEGAADFASGNLAPLGRSLVEQVGPPELLRGTRALFQSPSASLRASVPAEFMHADLAAAKDNLLRAYRAGVTLVTGSGAGNPLVFHGPTIEREIELWAQAGIPPRVALQAATANAAHLLRAGGRFGAVTKGREADLLIVDGNPLEDISAIERISAVIFKGERLSRSELFTQE